MTLYLHVDWLHLANNFAPIQAPKLHPEGWWQADTTCTSHARQAGHISDYLGEVDGFPSSPIQPRPGCLCGWAIRPFQRPVWISPVHAQQACQVWHKVLGHLWRHNILCIEDANLHGKSPGYPGELNQGRRVILDMMDGLQGNTMTCDSLFTSYALAKELLKRNIALVN